MESQIGQSMDEKHSYVVIELLIFPLLDLESVIQNIQHI